MIVIGLMSGTSFDAIDAAAAELIMDGDRIRLRPRGLISRPYPDDLRDELAAVLPPAATSVEMMCRLDTRIGQAFGAVAAEAVRTLADGSADLIASHGQTVFHWVDDAEVRGTLQIGQPAWIAAATGLPVVSNFRPADIAAGGQGAPLVSLIDVLWLRGRTGRPVALNLGGIANLTAAGDPPIAFDIGPANALIDAAVRRISSGRESYDRDGARAARGSVRSDLLDRLLADEYFARPAPKSTGKEHFNDAYLDRVEGELSPVNPDDLIATLTELTAVTVVQAVDRIGGTEVIISGGGARNPVLCQRLRDLLAPRSVIESGDLGLPSEAKEAYAFAVLGFLTAHGLPGTVPSCTGARSAQVLGSITPAPSGTILPGPATGDRPARRDTPTQLIIDS